MAKSRSRVVDYLVYLAVRLLVCFIQALSLEKARSLAAGLAWLAHKVDRRHRLIAHENLRRAFPGVYSYPELDALVRATYRHFCTLVVEMAFLPRKLHVANWRKYVEFGPECRPLADAVTSGRPLLIVTGHFGNWEMAGVALGLLGFRTHAVARELDNPYLENLLRKLRQSRGQQMLSKHGDVDRMVELLRGGGIMATLGDQDAGQRGLFVEFFGRPASTHKAIAVLALTYQVPILVIGVPKIAEPMRYRVEIADVILPEEYEGRGGAGMVKAMTQRMTSALEKLIRQHPEQYFWLHRRWKHQPKAKTAVAAA